VYTKKKEVKQLNSKALKTLEYNKIIETLGECALTSIGKEKCLELKPFLDIYTIEKAQDITTEASSMILKKGSLPLGGMKDIRASLSRVNVGGMLNVLELLHIGDFLHVVNKVMAYGKEDASKNDSFPQLVERFELLVPAPAVKKEIERCVLNEQDLADDASSGLLSIRKQIKISNDRIKEQINTVLRSQTYKNMLSDVVVTIRGGRFCVPVKQEYRTVFPGIIHDQSSTGATLFMEPMSVVNLNNKIKELEAEEKKEIEKILMDLSMQVATVSEELSANFELLAELDFFFAKGQLSISMFGSRPIFNTNGFVDIKKGRHPLLNKDTVVPTDIYIGDKFNTLLITGPNTGGKTVALKTLGLFSLMGQAGLHIPAFDGSKLTVFDNIFADIGDEQSIEQSLSTFSSHMTNIVSILKDVTQDSLVLMDELGAGTDPTEGAALAISIIQFLHDRKIKTAVTTHYSELKVYALRTDGVENASCEFDVVSLRPTYKLLIGVPGKSNAFSISKRLGLDDYIIDEAKKLLSSEEKKFEDVITDLEISRKTVELESARAEDYRKQAERLKSEIEQEREKMRKSKEKILQKAQEDAREVVRIAKLEADNIVKEMNKLLKEGNKQEINEKRTVLKEKLEGFGSSMGTSQEQTPRKVPKNLKKGDSVFIHSLNQKGVVTKESDGNGEVMVKAGIMSIKVKITELSLDENVETVTISNQGFKTNAKQAKSLNIRPEIDLRGTMVSEGLELADKYLDDAYLSGLAQVTIIHGKGTGALRTAIHNHLKKHPHVKSYRLGVFGEGEHGVTVVEFK